MKTKQHTQSDTQSQSGPTQSKPKTSKTRSRSRSKRKRKKLAAKRSSHVSKSVGAIVLNSRNHVLLVFQQKNQYWEFPKGKVEARERELDTLQREIYEETGIKRFRMIDGFRKSMYYDFQYKGKVIRRKVVYFLIKTRDRVRISDEHARYAWLPIEKAKKRLKHKNQMDLLDEVNQRIHHAKQQRQRKQQQQRRRKPQE